MDLKIVLYDNGRFPPRPALSGMWFEGKYEIDADLEYDNGGSTLWLSMEAWRDEGVWRVHSVNIDSITVIVCGREITTNVYKDAPDKESWLQEHISEAFEKYFQDQHEAAKDEMAGVP